MNGFPLRSAAWTFQDDIVKMYIDEGLSMRKIAAKVGVSRQTVYTILKDAKVTATQRGPKPAVRKANEYEGDILKMYVNERRPIKEISKFLDVSANAVTALLRSNGVEIKRGAMRSIVLPEFDNLGIGESIELPHIGLTKRQTYVHYYTRAKLAGINVSIRTNDATKVIVTRKS